MNKLHYVLLVAILISSCNEFSDRNIDQNTKTATPTIVENQLLGNLESINQGDFSREKMIANLGTFVVTPTVTNLKNEFSQFNVSYKQFCQTVNLLPDMDINTLNEMRKPVQELWKKTMTQYHRLASMNFGPGNDSTSTAMSSIYSYDNGTKCTLEQSVYRLAINNRPVQFFKIDNYNIRGLGSIEHLIFSDASQTVCPPRALEDRNPNRVEFGDWFRLGLHRRQKDKCSYNLALLEDITKKVDELYTAWSPNHKYFTANMLTGSKSPIEWLNEITGALYTLDTVTKDQKLTFPAGQDVMIAGKNTNCGYDSCPHFVEHKFSGFSLNALKASLEGFRYLFFGINPINGQNGMSYDDFLKLRGFPEIAQTIDEALLKLMSQIEKLSETTTLKELLTGIDKAECTASADVNATERKVEACALISDIRKITDLLKFELTSALQEVEVPKEASGDND